MAAYGHLATATYCFLGLVGLVWPVLGSLTPVVDLQVDGNAVVEQLQRLATFSDDPNPAVTRILFTRQDLFARQYVKQLMADAGLRIREDAMGNIFGRWEGSKPTEGAIVTGSHCDAIPLAGMYDGTVGVIGAIAAVKALKAAGFEPVRPITVLFFTSEEPTRFGLGCIGSRAMAGALDAATLAAKRDANGTSFLEAAKAAGYGLGADTDEALLRKVRIREDAIAAFVELHIEQGPLLERSGKQVGVVTAIAAPAALRVTFRGGGGHAGALLMADRHDASLAAAEVALAVESAALATGAPDTVATTGFWQIAPNAVNSVPREALLEIDIRDVDGGRRDSVVAAVQHAARQAGSKRGLETSIQVVNQDPPATASPLVVDAIKRSAAELNASFTLMPSRAYHDSLFMAQIAPTGMIFILCRNGWSHRPDEFASAEDIERGVKTLALTLRTLSAQDLPASASASRTEL